MGCHCRKKATSLQNAGPNLGSEYVVSAHISFLFPARKPEQHFSDATCGFIQSEPKFFFFRRPVSSGYVKYLRVKRFLLGHLVMCQATATSSEILLLIYCPLLSSSPVYRLCKVAKPFIKINSGAGVSFTCRQAEGINPRDQDLVETMMYVLFAPPVQPFNAPHAPFNRPLLLSVLTTS